MVGPTGTGGQRQAPYKSGEGPAGILARPAEDGASSNGPKRGKGPVAGDPGQRCCRDQWQAVLWSELGKWPLASDI